MINVASYSLDERVGGLELGKHVQTKLTCLLASLDPELFLDEVIHHFDDSVFALFIP